MPASRPRLGLVLDSDLFPSSVLLACRSRATGSQGAAPHAGVNASPLLFVCGIFLASLACLFFPCELKT